MRTFAFFKPEYLWALFFIFAIFIIHFFKHPKLNSVNLSTLQFLQTNAVISSKRRKLRKLLQLIVRILIVILLVFLFARPFDKKNILNTFSNPQASVFVWVDNTYSMTYMAGDKSLGQQSFDIIDSLHKLLLPTTRMFLYNHQAAGFEPYSQQYHRFNAAAGRIDLKSAMDEFEYQNKNPADAIFIICSDFQMSSSLVIDTLLKKTKKNYPILLFSFTPESPWNYSVKDVTYNEGIVNLKVNASGRNLESKKLIMMLDKMKCGERILNIKNNTTDSISIATGNARSTNGYCMLNAMDPMPFDNVEYFSGGYRSLKKVIVAGNKVKNYVIAAALRASGKDEWESVSLKSVNEITFEDLDTSDLVIVNSIDGTSRAIEAFCSTKGNDSTSVIFCLEANESTIGWSRNLLSKLSEVNQLSLCTPRQPVFPVLSDTVSDAWRHFPRSRIDEVSIVNYCKGINGFPLTRLNNGDTFISLLKDHSERNWAIFSTPIGMTVDNNLCQTGFFVPLIDRVAHLLVNKRRLTNDSWIAGEKRKNPFWGYQSKVTIQDYKGKIINNVTGQRFLSFDSSGLYRITPQNKRSVYIKVRPDPNESKIQYSLPEIINCKRSSVALIKRNMVINTIKNRTDRLTGIIPWLILASLLILEVVLWDRIVKKVS